MLTLILDTSLHVAQAALFENNALTAHAVKQGDKGQTDMLLPVLREAMAGRAWSDLSQVIVTTGPGVFTGIRAGIAAARALRLALGIDVVGVSTLDVLRAQTGADLMLIDAHKDEVYVQAKNMPPQLMKVDAVGPLLESAQKIAAYPQAFADKIDAVYAGKIVRVDMLQPLAIMQAAGNHPAEPMPFYVRAPDALPSTAKPLAHSIPA